MKKEQKNSITENTKNILSAFGGPPQGYPGREEAYSFLLSPFNVWASPIPIPHPCMTLNDLYYFFVFFQINVILRYCDRKTFVCVSSVN